MVSKRLPQKTEDADRTEGEPIHTHAVVVAKRKKQRIQNKTWNNGDVAGEQTHPTHEDEDHVVGLMHAAPQGDEVKIFQHLRLLPALL